MNEVKNVLAKGAAMMSAPLFTALAWYLASVNQLGFWSEMIAIAAVLIATAMANRMFSGNAKERHYARMIMATAVGSLLLLFLGRYNSQANGIPDITLMIALGLILIACTSVVIRVIRYIKDDGFSYWLQNYATSSLAVMALMILMVILCLSIWNHFGTQFVWLPIASIVALVVLIVASDDYGDDTENTIAAIIAGSAIIAGIISTLIETGFLGFQIIWGVLVWHLIIGLIILAVIAYTIFKIKKSKKEKKARALKEQMDQEKKIKAEEKEKADKAEADEKASEIAKRVAILLSRKTISTADIFFLIENNGWNHEEFVPLFVKLPLISLIKISHIKKQIAFDGSVKKLLDCNSGLFNRHYNDTALQSLIEQLNALMNGLKACEEYKGYSELMERVKESCPHYKLPESQK